jgi:hypothetical protein
LAALLRGMSESKLSREICISPAKYEGKTAGALSGAGRVAEGNRLSFVGPVALAGVIIILALCNCSKLFTSY